MLISSRITLTDTLRNNVLPASCATSDPVKLTPKINQHTHTKRSQKESNAYMMLCIYGLFVVQLPHFHMTTGKTTVLTIQTFVGEIMYLLFNMLSSFIIAFLWHWLDRKEGWASKNCCFQTVVLEKTPKRPLDIKEIKPVNLKQDQPWIFTGRSDAEAEAPVFWCEQRTHYKSPWCWERLRAGGEGSNRG